MAKILNRKTIKSYFFSQTAKINHWFKPGQNGFFSIILIRNHPVIPIILNSIMWNDDSAKAYWLIEILNDFINNKVKLLVENVYKTTRINN